MKRIVVNALGSWIYLEFHSAGECRFKSLKHLCSEGFKFPNIIQNIWVKWGRGKKATSLPRSRF